MSKAQYDAVVVGAGPNGLAAAITLAQAGRLVLLLEAKDTVGGGMRSAELTLPGFIHDICSAIHPLGVLSPFFRTLPLREHGLEWIYPPAEYAHPLDDGTAVIVERSIEATARGLGCDEVSYRRLMSPIVANSQKLLDELLGPLRFPHLQNIFPMIYFGLPALLPATLLARLAFRGERARAAFAGAAAHAIMPLDWPATGAFGLIFCMTAHAGGWPMARGGSQKIADALASYFRSLKGEVTTGHPVESIDDLPSARTVLLDVSPRQLLKIMGDRLPPGYRRRLEGYRYGPGVCKVDYALDGPIPWAAPECARAATVHLGGTFEEVAASERAAFYGNHSQKPFVLLAQHTPFDATRAPEGKHTAWAYCHVPNGSTVDMTDRIEAQIERFAPGFKTHVLARTTRTADAMERYNPNLIGGDIAGGVQDLRQLYTRPVARIVPYSTPAKGIFLCSSSTPPGGGVHGMCGYHAAKAALRTLQH